MLNRLVTTLPASNNSSGLITLETLKAAVNVVQKNGAVRQAPQIYTYSAGASQVNALSGIETLNVSNFAELAS